MDASTAAALVEESAKRSGLLWVRRAGLPPHDSTPARPVWHVWHDGSAYLLTGGIEQPMPERLDEPGARAEVTARSKDKGSRLVVWPASVERGRTGQRGLDRGRPVAAGRAAELTRRRAGAAALGAGVPPAATEPRRRRARDARRALDGIARDASATDGRHHTGPATLAPVRTTAAYPLTQTAARCPGGQGTRIRPSAIGTTEPVTDSSTARPSAHRTTHSMPRRPAHLDALFHDVRRRRVARARARRPPARPRDRARPTRSPGPRPRPTPPANTRACATPVDVAEHRHPGHASDVGQRSDVGPRARDRARPHVQVREVDADTRPPHRVTDQVGGRQPHGRQHRRGIDRLAQRRLATGQASPGPRRAAAATSRRRTPAPPARYPPGRAHASPRRSRPRGDRRTAAPCRA